jgi:predicted small secreted protein
MEKLISVFLHCLVLMGLLGLSGCNTVRGVGEDIRQVGSSIERAAK